MIQVKLRSDAKSLRTLLALMERSGDVHFKDIYRELGGNLDKVDQKDDRGRWYAQSWTSLYIRKLNRKLEPCGARIVPGRLRQTYCLTSLTH
jgi:hypothetical protein